MSRRRSRSQKQGRGRAGFWGGREAPDDGNGLAAGVGDRQLGANLGLLIRPWPSLQQDFQRWWVANRRHDPPDSGPVGPGEAQLRASVWPRICDDDNSTRGNSTKYEEGEGAHTCPEELGFLSAPSSVLYKGAAEYGAAPPSSGLLAPFEA